MAVGVYTEEKGHYQIDCRAALWSTDKVHADYHSMGLSILSDVDFIAEMEQFIYLIEYKNSNIPEAIAHHSDFDPTQQKYINKVTRKFYDSLHYLAVRGKTKPIKYIFIVDYPHAGATERKMLRNKIAALLPFSLQNGQVKKIIDDFQVVSIEEWNGHKEYSACPLIPR